MTRPLSRRAVLGAAAACSAGVVGVPRLAAAAAPRLRRGMNLWPWFALTREFPPPRTDYAWPPFQDGRPVPTVDDLRRLRDAGFDFVRLPVDPGPFLAFAGARRAALLETLGGAVALCLARDLSVVVTLMPNEATHFWNAAHLVSDASAPGFEAYRGLVADAARLLRGHAPGRVLLEPLNEPPQGCAATAWRSVQGSLLRAARDAAPSLPLIATGSCGGMIDGLTALDPGDALALAPVAFTFHFYEPYLFTHQGAPWMAEPVYRDLNAVPWPGSAGSFEATMAAVERRAAADATRPSGETAAALAETRRVLRVYFDARPDKGFVERYFARVKTWGDSHGIAPGGILLGEFGALRTDARYTAAPAPDRARYIRDVRQVAEASGFPWAFWNLFDGMGLMDETTRALDPAIAEALGLR